MFERNQSGAGGAARVWSADRASATARRRMRRGRGIAVAWLVAVVFVLVGVCSLAVDLGRVRVARTELQRTSDAAARAAVGGISSGIAAAQSRAVFIASQNRADEQAVTLDPNADIEFGTWDDTTHTFTVLSGASRSSANAARVAARRTASRGNPVPLMFAQVIGKPTADVSASSIAAIVYRGSYGIVGIDRLDMSGSSMTDSWNASAGTYSAGLAHDNGSVASNGNIQIQNSAAKIHGDATPGPGMSVTYPSGTVSGTTTAASSPLVYPPVNPGNIAIVNDNAKLPPGAASGTNFRVRSGTPVVMPAGKYYFTSFDLGSGATLDVRGDVTIYMAGNFSLSGIVKTYQNLPINFKVRMISGSATLNASASLYTDFYAPQSAIVVTSNSDLYGSVIGKTLSLQGNGAVHYDESLPSPNKTSWVIATVR